MSERDGERERQGCDLASLSQAHAGVECRGRKSNIEVTQMIDDFVFHTPPTVSYMKEVLRVVMLLCSSYMSIKIDSNHLAKTKQEALQC